MPNRPLVSVICLCYNHEKYVRQSINSVLNQSYNNIEIIVVDDHSTDNSVCQIKEILIDHPEIRFIANQSNLGNCRSFNKAFVLSKGEFIIDLATDDEILPARVEQGVQSLQKNGKDYGVNYCLVKEVDSIENELQSKNEISPEGDLYQLLIQKYFINPTSMIARREVLEKMNGYDESLHYEDFDFWVRSSRHFKYCHTPEALVIRRVLKSGHGQKQYAFNSDQMRSTFIVCSKVFDLNKSREEDIALVKRIMYELKHASVRLNLKLSLDYLRLYNRLQKRIKSNLY